MLKTTLLFILIICFQNIRSQTVSTVTAGSFQDGLAVDSQGNVYGSDFWADGAPTRIYKYDTNGNVSIFASGFVTPNGIGINSLDEIYVCDHYGNNIKKFSNDGTLLMTTTNGQFTTPAGIKAIPNTLDMLVVEYDGIEGNKIKRLASDGTVTTLFSGAPLNGPAGITFIGSIPYIANFNDRKIYRFVNNSLIQIAQLPSSGNPQNDSLGFLTSANGMLYATHIGRNSIYIINSNTGQISLFAGSIRGGQDGNISIATFNGPNGIVAHPNTGKIYVSDAGTAVNPVKNLRIIENAFLSTDDFISEEITLDISPNPVKDSLQIQLKLNFLDPIKIEIFDITGKSIYKKNIALEKPQLSMSISTAKWQKGTYFLHCIQNNKKVTKKIII